MFINKTANGRNNICEEKIAELRKNTDMSQRQFAELLEEYGITVDKNAIQRIECGKRFVTDIELIAISKALNCNIDKLLEL